MKHARIEAMKNHLGSPSRPTVLVLLSLAMSVIAPPELAQAQSWRIEPVVKAGGEYDDNATLNIRTDSEVKLKGFLADLRADVTYSSATTSLFLQPRATLRTYSGESSFDSNDFYLRSRFSHKGKSSTIGFRASFDDQTVRTGERAISNLEIDNPDEITNDDSGRVLLSGGRKKWNLAPFWDYRLSKISSVRTDLDYVDAQYENTFAGVLFDYTDVRIRANYRRALSNLQTAIVSVSARNYSSGESPGDVKGYGVMVGFERILSEKMRLNAMIGMEDTQQTAVSFNPEVVGNVTLTRDLETIRMFAQYRRSVSGSGAGTLAVRDALNINFRRRLNEKITAGLGVRAYRSRGTGDSLAFDDRNYVQLQSSFLWYLSTSLVVEANYRYTVNDRSAAIGERANSNQVNLWFTYQPRTIPKL